MGGSESLGADENALTGRLGIDPQAQLYTAEAGGEIML